MSRAAIVVPTLGTRPAWLHDCLHSILMQEGVDFTVVVVAPSSADLAACDGFDVAVARTDETGLSAAVTLGWMTAGHPEYVTWLGDDDLLAPGSLRSTTSFLDEHPRHSMVYGRARYIDEHGNTLWISRPTRLAAAYLRFGKNFLTQQGSLLRRSAVDSVGGLDRSLRNAMDQDLFTRLGRVGSRGYLPIELAAYRWHSGSITSRKGPSDEGDLVRRRYISSANLALYRGWRRFGVKIDWALDAFERRLPVPDVPLLGGRPYTSPAWRSDG
jgi:GT2 family glycosyltransferase